ncbi:porin family protein [Limibacter armeniacum]|uniref:porin family protein n=1 Tax=Limibacter armeniacum TaxID=466084 RepID=UPI002FE5774E
MNKAIYIFSLIIGFTFFSQVASAQQNMLQKGQFAAGLRGGILLPSMTFSPGIAQLSLNTQTAGVIFQYFKEKKIGLQWEVNYETKGYQEAISQGVALYKREFDQVAVPVLAHIYFPIKRVHIFVNAGAQANYLLDESSEVYGDLSEQRYDYFDREPHQLSVDLVVGGGLSVLTGIGHFQLEARYFAGMTDSLERPERTSSESAYFQGANISFAYLIPITGWKNNKTMGELQEEKVKNQ